MLDVAKPMLGMVETQVWLAQGAWRRAVAQAEALLAPCQTLHYALVRLHLLIQLAAAYARLDDRAAADAHLRQALAEAEPDGLVMPFAENYRDLKPALDGLAADSAFLREIRTHGAAMESRISALRHGGGEPDGALTARERELAEHVAQRLSNREIAERMYLSEGTVQTVCQPHLCQARHRGQRAAEQAAGTRGADADGRKDRGTLSRPANS